MPSFSEDDTQRYRLERETLHEVSSLKTDVAVLKREVADVRSMMSVLITRPEFAPVKLLVYSMAGSLLAGIVAALLSLVLHK